MKLDNWLSFIGILFFLSPNLIAQSSQSLWYQQPATYFEESLVLGNGKMGATVFGGVESEKIYLNDATLWAGEPVDPNMNQDAHTYIPAIREALRNENYQLADSLIRFVQGSFSESFAPLGTMFLRVDHEAEASAYRRELSLEEAVARVNYTVAGVDYTREYFVSHPDQVMGIRLTSSREGALNVKLGFESLMKYQTTAEENVFKVNGYAPYHAEPVYRGDMPNAVQFDENRGTRFTALFEVQQTDGEVTHTDTSLAVNNATEAVLMVSIATSFNGFDKDPAKEGLDNEALAAAQLDRASAKTFESLKNDHLEDYRSFFSRVSLDLGASGATDLPTDERLKRYTEGAEDKGMEELYFQFGRYLLIASSRTEGVPANLQGIWNPYLRPPWSSNYTVNINVEENYWIAETGNLPEMHRPLMTFIENVAETGAVTAKTFYGVDQGWSAGHNSDIWAMSNPVGDFGKGSPVWANWNMGGVWLSTHLWEHYIFTKDEAFLQEKGYPLMKGAAEFCLGWLVEDKQGYLVTSPSTSPENLYVTPDGYVGATLYGAAADLAMIRELFDQTIRAAKILEVDANFRDELKNTLDRLYPYQIGKKGNLQEWYYDWEDNDPKHRHQSHLFGLYPGDHISPEETPELAEACRRTLEIKGDESTGWSKGWRINLWARLLDGNHAYRMYRELLTYVDPSGLEPQYSEGGGTYPNLFDAHPPFQIDGNFGGAAGVIEMLMQSSESEIRLLPALPDAWASGSVEGICARGGFVVSIEWKDKQPERVRVRSRAGGKTTLVHGGKRKEIVLAPGEELAMEW